MKAITEIIVKIKIEEELTKEKFEKAIEQKSLEDRKEELEHDIVAELKDIFDTKNIEVHDLNLIVKED